MNGEIVETESKVWTCIIAERNGGAIGTGESIPERVGKRTRRTEFYVRGEGSDPREWGAYYYADTPRPEGDRGEAAANALAGFLRELDLPRDEFEGHDAVEVIRACGGPAGNGFIVRVSIDESEAA